MTVICFASVKGSPGVTTTTCLVGASWESEHPVVVVECDPAGGDLAARFSLSSTTGWPSYVSAVRRAGSSVPLQPHLQQLPGGLAVLAGTRRTEGEPAHAIEALLGGASSASDGPVDLMVDLGRLSGRSSGRASPGRPSPDGVVAGTGADGADSVDGADAVVIVLRGDAAAVMHVAARSSELIARWGDRVGLVLIGAARHPAAEIEEFVGVPVIAELPFDPQAAAVASGQGAGRRRLRRSSLVTAAARLADALPRAHGAHGLSPSHPVPGHLQGATR